jgi:hypothetical protein
MKDANVLPYIQVKETATNQGFDFDPVEMGKVFKFNIMTFEFEKGNVNFYKAKYES